MKTPIMFQSIEIRKIGHPRQTYHRHIHCPGTCRRSFCLQRHRIFLLHPDIPEIRNYPHNRHPCQPLHNILAFVKKRNITPEFINNYPLQQSPLFLRQQHYRTVNRSKNPAPVYISHQISCRVRLFCHAHIRNIPVPEVQFRNTTGPFQDDRIVLRTQSPESLNSLGE